MASRHRRGAAGRAQASAAPHLRVYRFAPGATFEGGLLAAIERMELGTDTRLLDALFVRREPATGALEAVDLSAAGARASFASLLDFRLDADRRRTLTERTLAEHPGGVGRPLIEEIGGALDVGAALFAVLSPGAPALLDDAAARCGGWLIADEETDARTLADAGARLRRAVAAP